MPPGPVALVERLFIEVYNQPNLAAAAQAATSIFQFPQPFINQYALLRTAFPDWQSNRELTLYDSSYVTVRWSGRGTQQGVYRLPYVTVPATGQFVTVLGITIYEVSGGKIISSVSSNDSIEALHQLGVRFVPPPTQHSTPRLGTP